MDRQELLVGFIRENLKLITADKFPDALYKKNKHQYFLEKHASAKQGVPRDQEIAGEALWFLIRHAQVSDEATLKSFLDKEFFKEKVAEPAAFYEYISMTKPKESTIDYQKMQDSEYVQRLRSLLTEELRKELSTEPSHLQNLEAKINEKLAEYYAIPSVLDIRDFQEPDTSREEAEAEEYLPWWQQLNLTQDPFPTVEGLQKLTEDDYETIVYKTPLFQKYISLVQIAPQEIFKNTIFFGEFGSGKTTLFEYLRKALLASQVIPVYIQLFSEKDFQSLKLGFKQKMLREIQELLLPASTKALELEEPEDIDERLFKFLKLLQANTKAKGVVFFVDDLHKNKEDFEVAMEFLSYLQIFTSELVRHAGQNTAFYIAGSLEWESTIRSQARFSGSLARRETIPEITEAQAYEMLNRRLSAFYPNPEVRREIDRAFVSQVYRDLKLNNLPLTFRSFIQRITDEFKEGNFKVLTSDPVHIKTETLEKIKSVLESSTALKEKLDFLFFKSGIESSENRTICIRLLIDIFLKKGVREQDYEEKWFYLQKLARARLISKAKDDHGTFRWVPTPELVEKNREIYSQFSLSLEDYLIKLYGLGRLWSRKGKILNEELEQIQAFIKEADSELAKQLKESLGMHKEIITQQETFALSVDESDLVNKCRTSLEYLTSIYLGSVERLGPPSPKASLAFWKDYWFSPGEVAQFVNTISDEQTAIERIWYICSLYRQAFGTLFNFIRTEYQYLATVPLSSKDLSKEDMEALVQSRNMWSGGKYSQALRRLERVEERKLQVFVYNVFTLLYGDLRSRLEHIDSSAKAKIVEIRGSTFSEYGKTTNEFSVLPLHTIIESITEGPSHESRKNWEHIFTHVFGPLSSREIRTHVQKLETKEPDGSEDTSDGKLSLDVREQILFAAEVLKRVNSSYISLLTKGLSLLTQGGTLVVNLSFDGMRDKSAIKGIPIVPSIAGKLESNLESGPLNLDNSDFIQEYFGVPYRDFFAFLGLASSDQAKALNMPTIVQIAPRNGAAIEVKKRSRIELPRGVRVFICHSSTDNEFAKALATDLSAAGVQVWYDEFEIKVGHSITQKVNEGLAANDFLAIVLTPAAVSSEWVKRELSSALLTELESRSIVVLPLLLKQCETPPLIKDKRYANFTKNYDTGLADLLEGIRTHMSDRKPDNASV